MPHNTKSQTKTKSESSNGVKDNRLKLVNVISDIGQILLIILLVIISVASFGARIPVLAKQGLQFYAVTSGSMQPAIPTGALIKVGGYQLDELASDDIITFTVPSQNSQQPNIVTHRIKTVDKQEETKIIGEGDNQTQKKVVAYRFITQGDANNKEDDYQVKPADILGKYQWHIPFVGYVSAFSQTATGFILLVIIPALILIVWEVVSLVNHFRQKALDDSQAEIKRLKQQLADQSQEKSKL